MSTSSYPVSGPIDLQVRLGFGSLTVHADENVTAATVDITPRDPDSDCARRTVVEMRHSTLVVHSPKPRGTVFDFPIFGARFSERDALDVETEEEGKEVIERARSVTFLPERRGVDDSVQFDGRFLG